MEATKSIWKYQVSFGPDFDIELPIGADIVHAGVQNNDVYIWACVYTKAPKGTRSFKPIATGEEIPFNAQYIATVQTDNGYVWHIHEIL